MPSTLVDLKADATHVTDTQKAALNIKTPNTGKVTSISAGIGLAGSTINTTGTLKAYLKSETASTLKIVSKGSTSGKEYAVGIDKNSNLSVNNPWEDHIYIYCCYCRSLEI